MRDDRSSFIRNAKESSTELDALAANVRGDGNETKEWGTDSRAREGAQSPEEQYGRFRPMSQASSLRPFTEQSNSSLNSMPHSMSSDLVRSISRDYPQGVALRGPAPVRGPRDYEGYSNAYGLRSESPVPRPPGSSGTDLWKRGVGFD